MPVFSSQEFDNHEQVVFCSDADSGLKAIIAIHNTNRGPGLAGGRMCPTPAKKKRCATFCGSRAA